MDFVLFASDSEVASGPMRDKKGWVGIQQAFHSRERQGDLLAEPLERALKNLTEMQRAVLLQEEPQRG